MDGAGGTAVSGRSEEVTAGSAAEAVALAAALVGSAADEAEAVAAARGGNLCE